MHNYYMQKDKHDGEEAYQGKLLEARQSDWKDEAVHNIKFARFSACIRSHIG